MTTTTKQPVCPCCDGRGYEVTELESDYCRFCGGSGKAKGKTMDFAKAAETPNANGVNTKLIGSKLRFSKFVAGQAVTLKTDKNSVYVVVSVGWMQCANTEDDYFGYVIQASFMESPESKLFREEELLGFFEKRPTTPAKPASEEI